MCLSVLRASNKNGDGPFAMPPSEAPERESEPARKVRWADEEPLDTVAAEQVARALADNCASLEKRIAELAEPSLQPTACTTKCGATSRAPTGEERERG